MSWLQNIRAFFGKKDELPILETPSLPPVSEPQIQVIEPVVEEELPHWLSSEDMLRDEGVIYGLSGTNPEEKVSIIHSIYKKHLARHVQSRDELNEKIGELNLILENKNSQLTDLKSKAATTLARQEGEENILRVAIGLLLSLGMCAGNYFLIREGVAYGFPDESQWISWGVFLTGMFSLYYATAAIHNDDKITWRRALEEFGMPLAASVFVYVQVIPHMVWYKSLAFLIFTFFIFLVSGKLLLGSIAKLKKEISVYKQNAALKADKKLAETEWLQDMEAIEQAMEKIRLEKWKIVSSLNESEATIERINSDKEAVTNLFLSEYHLAKNYKDKLSGSQISKILNK